jgi:hypothetical protein
LLPLPSWPAPILKQLVLKLKLGVRLLELLQCLPCSFCCGAISPSDQQLPRCLSWPGAQHLCRLEHHSAVHNGWQRRDFSWSSAFKSPQELNMEDIVNAGAWWKLQAVCHGPDTLQHLVRPEEFWGQLGWTSVPHRHNGVMVQAQPHRIAHRELERPVLLVML